MSNRLVSNMRLSASAAAAAMTMVAAPAFAQASAAQGSSEDPARQQELPGRVEFSRARHLAAGLRHAPVGDPQVGARLAPRRHDRPTANDQLEHQAPFAP